MSWTCSEAHESHLRSWGNVVRHAPRLVQSIKSHARIIDVDSESVKATSNDHASVGSAILTDIQYTRR
jgi:hypothetical protein